MKVKVFYDSWVPGMIWYLTFGGVDAVAVTLWYWIFMDRSKADANLQMLKHEMVHIKQIRKDGIFTWTFTYVWDFLKNYFWHYPFKWGKAYEEIPYEVEAYQFQAAPLSNAERAELGLK